MILTGLPSEVSATPAPGHNEFWRGLVVAYCPFLGVQADTLLRDYGSAKKDLTTGAGTASGSACPAGRSHRLATDTVRFNSLTGHSITKTWTAVVVIYHAEGSAFSSQWPQFRDARFSRDGSGNHTFAVKQNTNRLWLQYWNGASYTEINGVTTLPFKQPFTAGCRVSETAGSFQIFLDGKQEATASFTAGNSLVSETLSFHYPDSTGEWSPYHVLAHYIWREAKTDAFIARISRDWAGPFRRLSRTVWFVGAGGSTTSPTPVVATASVAAPTVALSAPAAPVSAPLAVAAPASTLSATPTPVATTGAMVGPAVALSQATAPVSAASAAPSAATVLAPPVSAVSASSTPVAGATALSQPASAVGASLAIAGPALAVGQAASAVVFAAQMPAPGTALSRVASAMAATFAVVTPSTDGTVTENPAPVLAGTSVVSPTPTLVAGGSPVASVATPFTPATNLTLAGATTTLTAGAVAAGVALAAAPAVVGFAASAATSATSLGWSASPIGLTILVAAPTVSQPGGSPPAIGPTILCRADQQTLLCRADQQTILCRLGV